MPHGASLVPGDGRPTFGRSKLGPKNRRANEKNIIKFWISEGHPPSPGAEEVNGLFQTFTSQATGHRVGSSYHRVEWGASAWRFWTQMFRGPGFLLVFFYYLFLWVKWRFWRLHPNVCSTPPPFFWNCVHKPFFQLKIMLPTICRLWHPSCPIFHMAILPGCSRIKTLKSDWNQILSWNFWKIACIVRQL